VVETYKFPATTPERQRPSNPNQYERHKTLFVLRGFSGRAIACLDELDSWFPHGTVINEQLQATTAAERSRLAQDPWFVGRLRARLDSYELGPVLFTLGLGPKPPEPKPFHPRVPTMPPF
jgi:hypothetical protein